MTPYELLRNIDYELLRLQKQQLLGLVTSEFSPINPDQHAAIEGIITLIDSIQDCAVDNEIFSESEVFGNLLND